MVANHTRTLFSESHKNFVLIENKVLNFKTKQRYCIYKVLLL